jgi:hypothetical protein
VLKRGVPGLGAAVVTAVGATVGIVGNGVGTKYGKKHEKLGRWRVSAISRNPPPPEGREQKATKERKRKKKLQTK